MSLYRPLSQIDSLVLHCTDTPNGRHTTVEDIDLWHGPDRVKRGLKPFVRRGGSPLHMPHLKHIGYHFVIYTNGAIVCGRSLNETGAHALDKRFARGSMEYGRFNRNAIATAIVGRDAFSLEQWDMARRHVKSFLKRFPHLKIHGHNELDDGKTCPGFNVPDWRADGMQPLEGHIYTPQ